MPDDTPYTTISDWDGPGPDYAMITFFGLVFGLPWLVGVAAILAALVWGVMHV